MCYYVILQYGACCCKTMYLVHCDKGDPPKFMCEGDDKHLIAKYVFGSQCEPCLTKLWRDRDDELDDQFKDQLEGLQVECLPTDQEQRVKGDVMSSHRQALKQTERHVERRLEGVDEAGEWVRAHARATFTRDADELVSLARVKPRKMTVMSNDHLFKRARSKNRRSRSKTKVPEPSQTFLAGNEAGPSTKPARFPSKVSPGQDKTVTDADGASSSTSRFESGFQKATYIGKGKEKEVSSQSGQQPSNQEPGVDQEDIDKLQELEKFTAKE